eukprot:SAG31_NODE_39187_length_290_cov_0.816754_1_plen_49_part_10
MVPRCFKSLGAELDATARKDGAAQRAAEAFQATTGMAAAAVPSSSGTAQ